MLNLHDVKKKKQDPCASGLNIGHFLVCENKIGFGVVVITHVSMLPSQ